MAIMLPEAIEAYFSADRDGGVDAVLSCFTDDAIVKDEGETHAGKDAIPRWKAGASRKYTYTVEPISIATEGPRTVVTSHMVGDFPGSPVDLRYLFVLTGARISHLEIVV